MDPEIIGEDFIDFKCPHCGALNSFPTSAARHVRECVHCLEAFLVPETDGGDARPIVLPIDTQHLRLRRFKPGDWLDLLEFRFEEEGEAISWIHEISKTRLAEFQKHFFLAIEKRDTEKVIGMLRLKFIDFELNQMEVDLAYIRDDAVHELKVEALETLLEFCFVDLNLHRVIAESGSGDTDGRRPFEKIGMRQEAEFRKSQYFNGEWHSLVWFAMLEEEFFKDFPGSKPNL
jgi:RimJ/RimL family protein N-acetyltransferase